MKDDASMPDLTAHNDAVASDLSDQCEFWSRGHTRRRFLAGVGAAGVVGLGGQLVTAKAAFGATRQTNTLVCISLRGAADGLRMLVPAASSLGLDYLMQVRPTLVPSQSALVPLSGAGGWALNSALSSLVPFWSTGELAFVPAASNGGVSRSHFQAQAFLDAGGDVTNSSGWLDRLLVNLGRGTTFRAFGAGTMTPPTMLGEEHKIVLSALRQFAIAAPSGAERATAAAISGLYRGLSGSLPEAVGEALSAVSAVRGLTATAPQNGARYPAGNVGAALADIACLLRGEVGLQVAAVDVGGWDTHTAEATLLDQQLLGLAQALSAFMTDLGPDRRSRVTVVVTTEFGRRVVANGSGGADHGHGSVMMILGGGLASSAVAGRWAPLDDSVLDQGDVPGLNDPFQVLSEVVRTRLRVSNTRAIFPTVDYAPLGIMRRS